MNTRLAPIPCVLPHIPVSRRRGLRTDCERYMGVSVVRLSDMGLRAIWRWYSSHTARFAEHGTVAS